MLKTPPTIKQRILTVAELFDAWRVYPRLMVVGYAYLLCTIIVWYMSLEPYIMDNCISEDITKCIVEAPTTQHAALVTAVVGIAAALFGLYTSSGRKWKDNE